MISVGKWQTFLFCVCIYRSEKECLPSPQHGSSRSKYWFASDHITIDCTLARIIKAKRVCVCVPVHFAETGTTSPHLAPVVTSQHDVVSCAASCYYSHQIVCNSFDLCPDQSCYLSTRHVPDGNVTNSSAVCRHFSRKPHVCV